MNWSTIFSKLLDPYDLKARLFPGLLVLLPGIVFLGSFYGSDHPVLATLGAALAVCGGPYALASLVRSWGQQAQEKLYVKWGGMPTTILLRHRDSRLAIQTKQLYHKHASEKLGIRIPTPDEEAADPIAADQAYMATADALRLATTNNRQKFPLVFKELVAYGFNRNAYGAKWVGVFVSSLSIAATLLHETAVHAPTLSIDGSKLYSIGLAGGVTMFISGGLLILWLFHYSSRTVEMAGYSYALRLFEALNGITKKAGKATVKKAT